MAIKSLRLVVTPGDPRTAVEITTLNAAGQDVGYAGVLADGKQYQAAFDFVFTPDGGTTQTTSIFGTGGTEPLYAGKRRDEKDPRITDPDPGTGPNPGYSLGNIDGFNVGSSAWFYDLGFRFMLNHKHAPNGAGTIKGHVDGVGSTQSVSFRIDNGKLRKLAD